MATQKIIKQVQKKIADLQLLYLFGSRVSDQHRPDSDWDIAFLADHNLTVQELFELKEYLANALGSEVDLIDLRNTTTVLQMQVIQEGRLLWGDQAKADVLAMQVLSMYGELQVGRADIVGQFKTDLAEKAVYE